MVYAIELGGVDERKRYFFLVPKVYVVCGLLIYDPPNQ